MYASMNTLRNLFLEGPMHAPTTASLGALMNASMNSLRIASLGAPLNAFMNACMNAFPEGP